MYARKINFFFAYKENYKLAILLSLICNQSAFYDSTLILPTVYTILVVILLFKDS